MFVTHLKGDINIIRKTDEKYISFSEKLVVGSYVDKKAGKEKDKKIELRFLDSLKFTLSSLDKLAGNLKEFKNLEKELGKSPLLKRKGVFPEDWFGSIEKLDETSLPPKEAFYSSLNNSEISDDDYERSMHKRFGMSSDAKQ